MTRANASSKPYWHNCLANFSPFAYAMRGSMKVKVEPRPGSLMH